MTESTPSNINAAIVWCGIIWSAVAENLLTQELTESIARRTWVILNLKAISTRNPEWAKSSELYRNFPQLFSSHYINWLLNDSSIDVIIETIWWTTLALELISAALYHWKHVVTANKDLMALHWDELRAIAAKNWVQLRYSASVAWAIPIIDSLRLWIPWDDIRWIRWIMNWTTNYMLTNMANGVPYDQCLKEAQNEWFAEKDPTNDVELIDPTYKLLILIRETFWKTLKLNDITRKWITELRLEDFKFAKNKWYNIKALAVARLNWLNALECFVEPVMIVWTNNIARQDWVGNIIEVTWKWANTCYSWPWAWWPATATAVISDLVNIGRNIPDSLIAENPNIKLVDMNTQNDNFYVRFCVPNNPWILATVTSELTNYWINISAVEQEEGHGRENVYVQFIFENVSPEKLEEISLSLKEKWVIFEPPYYLRVVK